MALRLSNVTSNRDNNFNLIRFTAAVMVLFGHSFALSGNSQAEPFTGYLDMHSTISGIAVDIFFITSGFLVTGSLLTRKNLLAFVCARALRIYPALIISILFCVFIVGLYFTTMPIYSYIIDAETWRFLLKDISIIFGLYGNLPGVFQGNPLERAVNGSLWTLPWEIRMYAILVIFGLLLHTKKKNHEQYFRYSVAVLGLMSVVFAISNHLYLFAENANVYIVYSMRLIPMFFMGATLYILRERILLSHRIAAVMVLLFILSLGNKDLLYILYELFVAYLVIYIAYYPSGRIRKFNKMGDYSYGIYIYAFPVQQSVAAIIKPVSYTVMITLSFLITLMLAILSWHLVEKEMLRMKDRYIVIEKLLRFRLSTAK